MRNLTNGEENINVVITNYMEAALPLQQTQANTLSPIVLSIKGLSTMGADGQIMKVNSSGELYWSADTDTTYTGTAPIVITGTTISYDNTTTGTFTNKTFGDLTMFESSLSCRNSTSSGYIRLYTNGASSTNFVDLFTPNNLTQDHTIFLPSANGILALTTDLIQPNYGGTGKSSLSGETGKVLRVNSNENGYDFYTLPSPITQYWGLSGNVLSPTSSYDLQVAEIINIGSSTVYYQLKTDTTNNAFQLTETDGTTVLKYTSNGRLDFGYSILIGSNPAYPAGQGLPFGTTGTIYSSSIYSKIITTDDITLSEYGASPPTTQSYIRCNSSGNLTFSAGGEFTTGLKVGGAIAFDDLGTGATSISYIYDPRQNSGAPSTTNNAFNFHSNGTEVNLNCRVAAGGTSSAVNLKFAGSTLYRFNENLTMDVGSNAFSFPSSSGTLAKIGDIAGNSYISSVDTVFSVDGNGRLSLGVAGVVEGGTGQNSITNGDLLYGKPLNSMGKIAIGSTGQYLKVVSGIPAWVTETNTNFFSITGSDIYATDTTDNLMLGMSSFFPAAKLGVQGNTWLAGQVTINESALLIGLYFSYLYDTTNGRGVISNPSSVYTNKNILTWADNDVGLCVPQSTGDINFRFADVIKMTFDASLTKLTGQLEVTDFVIIGDSVQIGTNLLSVYGDAVITGDLTLYTPATGDQDDMPKIKFNSENDNCYMSEQMVSNAPSGDMVWKIGGGDIRMFRDNTPNASASNYQALFFLYGSANDNTFYIYAGGTTGSSSNIYLNSTTFSGNLPYSGTSDDRLKTEEKLIDNATETLMKLRPQTYMKQCHMGTEELPAEMEYNFDKHLESGLIAQEIYYNAPELRHIIKNTEGVEELPEGMDINDLQNDPDWNGLGWSKDLASSVSYTELIPYLIKSNQEQETKIIKLETELDTYKSIVDKLIFAPSFKSFKESLI